MDLDLRQLSDENLLAASTENVEAFGEVYRRHAEPVLAYLLHRTRDAETALDLTAEVFAAALMSIRRYDPTRGPVRAWLFGIAARKLAAQRRRWWIDARASRRLGMQRIEFEDEDFARVEDLIDLDRRDPPLEVMLGGLPPGERRAVLARVVDQLQYKEIATALGCSEGAVRTRVSRGLARLALSARGQQQ